MLDLHELHPRNNAFPGEVLLELAAEAIEESGASRADPIDYEGIRGRYLPEFPLQGGGRGFETLSAHGKRAGRRLAA